MVRPENTSTRKTRCTRLQHDTAYNRAKSRSRQQQVTKQMHKARGRQERSDHAPQARPRLNHDHAERGNHKASLVQLSQVSLHAFKTQLPKRHIRPEEQNSTRDAKTKLSRDVTTHHQTVL